MNRRLAQLTRFVRRLPDMGDGHLLTMYLEGDQSAFQELVLRHGPMVYNVCNRILRHRQDAEDAFQAVFIVLARRAVDIWPRDAIGGWLHGVAMRVAMKARTRRMLRQARETELGHVSALSERLAVEPECDVAELIHRAIGKLPEMYRAALIACDLEGLSRQAAASRLGWKEGTLSGRLARARKLLAARLRRDGAIVPAAGVAAVLGTSGPVRGELVDRVLKLIDPSAQIATSLASLTHGVAPSMVAFKLKAAAAALLAACFVGFGAWTVGAGEQPGSPAGSTRSAPNVDFTRARNDLRRIEQDLAALAEESKAAGGANTDNVKQRVREAEAKLAELRQILSGARVQSTARGAENPSKLEPALIPLQGRWKVESISDGIPAPVLAKHDLVIEIDGDILQIPGQEIAGAQYRIVVDNQRNPATIDLIPPGMPVIHGIYEFMAPRQTCMSCHTAPLPGIKSFSPHAGVQSCSVCHKATFDHTKKSTEDFLVSCKPGARFASGLRLEFANSAELVIGGVRPSKFGGGKGLIQYQLSRLDSEKNQSTQKLMNWLQPPIRINDADFLLKHAQADENAARGRLQQSQSQLAQAQAVVDQAKKNLSEANLRLAEAEKAAATEKRPHPEAPKASEFTIHIRTQLAPEKVVRMTASNVTVLDSLASTLEGKSIKPSDVSVWIVRNGSLMPVNLTGITQQGDTTTNYLLMAGDLLFIQQKPVAISP